MDETEATSMTNGNGNGNGNGNDQRVTNATLALKIDLLSERINEYTRRMDGRIDSIDSCYRKDHDQLIANTTAIKTQDNTIDNLIKKSDTWSVINSLGVGVAMFIGWLK